ncbi:C45 family autoproteolytic acyltransferase/hydrolase [Alsobacter sp. SYSU M60028]|uniref:C45 family autoproteolytic acyltransferase/hydrolase n=1 Tax=Alsobacter ponti TaxID=2962936 RepID=A0ABT1L981_9HYPH|nr:C45 family peptidase [Alsobacter ponti]MCP8937508.1 C45 family autoproteolytic acyltransferase/hydrolase [Alsobacter ponti]
MFAPEPARPVLLLGDARARGLAQAAAPGTDAEAVRAAVRLRLDLAAALLDRVDVRAFLAAQEDMLDAVDPEGADEMDGIAEGFAIDRQTLLAYLHLGVLGDFTDGCSAFAHSGGGVAPLLVKNRDYRGEHAALQRVFLHRDPARPGADMLLVGSLGSPGAFSSGMNARGLALVDTHVGSSDHGLGLLRYFLMTRLLRRCADVGEALDEIAALPQAGGGTMVLCDRAGRHAAVELGHRATGVEADARPWRARTNHFLLDPTRASFRAHRSDPMATSTTGRLARIEAALAGFDRPPVPADAARLMAGHADGGEALCRHGQDGDSLTISTSVFAPAEAKLYFSPQRPCAGRWLAYDFD